MIEKAEEKLHHICLLSGGHSSAKVAIYVVQKYGKDNVTLLNHNINPKYESADIKRYKQEIADYLELPITYANIDGISKPEDIPSQFEVCIKAKAITDYRTGQPLCTNRIKTGPFIDFLDFNFPLYSTLFEEKKDVIIYYGFDENEQSRITRRSSIMGALGYKTDYPISKRELLITDTNQIGIKPPSTYSIWIHANCIGCLKAGLLHWYCVYCLHPDIYAEGIHMEEEVDFFIHRVTRNGELIPMPLSVLAPIFEAMKKDGYEPSEHLSSRKFANQLRKYEIEQCNINKPCECTD